ncbi:hypothetical protein NIES267_71050 [Calothrix parasitica NIES-267]|uniref:Uncharacterized protein n=1 Tax=Calothrix parasitica NIES-267 TaxID=1973488 RepID=A0A1Z4M2E6_9CYAN|nr:hypothetical protein NIES267_71050 [Calothrix parasitica NIES-267]
MCLLIAKFKNIQHIDNKNSEALAEVSMLYFDNFRNLAFLNISEKES